MLVEKIIQYRRLILLGLGIVLVATILFNVFRPRAVINISTNQEALIFVATEQGGEFKEIGKGRATYKTREEGPVYIEVERDGNKSQTSAVATIGETKQVALDIRPRATKNTKLFDGSVQNIFLKGTSVFGISPGSSDFVSFSTQSFKTTDPKYMYLPYVKEILWTDENNFIYNTYSKGLGVFKNGKDTGTKNVGVKQIGGYQGDNTAGPATMFVDITQHPKKPLVLVGDRGMFTSTNNAYTLKHIADVDVSGIPFLASDEKYIYYARLPYPGEYTDEFIEDETTHQHDDSAAQITLQIFTYSGEVVDEVALRAGELKSLLARPEKDTLLLATGSSALKIKLSDDSTEKIAYYFESIRDSVVLKNKMTVMSESGIWQFDDTTNIFYLVHGFDDGQSGLSNSIQLSGASLVYGTVPKQGADVKSETFRLDVSSWLQ